MVAMNTGQAADGEAERRAQPEDRGEAILMVDGLTVRYGGDGGTVAVNDASFSVQYGERVALVGESGSGKTTLGLAIAGFLTAESAQVSFRAMSFCGEPIHTAERRLSPLPTRVPGISMMFQDAMTSLDAQWTVGSQMRAVLHGAKKLNRADTYSELRNWLERVGLRDADRVLNSRPYELSGGMRQRVMLATVLCGDPSLVVADEPTSALDASITRQTMDLLRELTSESSTSLLIISHDIKMCMEYAARIMVMYRGTIVDSAPPARLAAEATHPYTRGLLGCVPTLETRSMDRLPTLVDFLPAEMAEERIAQ